MTAAASLSPHNARALTLLGRTDVAQENYPAARSALEQAVLADDDNWLLIICWPTHTFNRKTKQGSQRSSNRNHQRPEGRKDRRESRRTGPRASAHRSRAEPGGDSSARSLPKGFSPESPGLPGPQPGRRTQESRLQSTSTGETNGSDIDTSRADPLGAVPDPALTTQTWRPPDIDDVEANHRPRGSMPCRASHRRIGEKGAGVRSGSRPFRRQRRIIPSVDRRVWLCNSHRDPKVRLRRNGVEPEPGLLSIEEYRSDKSPQEGYPDGIASTGFVMLALVFHPGMQRDFNLDCEGQANGADKPVG